MSSFGDIDELRDRAHTMLRAVGGAPAAASRRCADASDVVWVTVDAKARVVDIEVDRGWRERIAVSELAPALFEAYTVALRTALEAAALAALASEAHREPQSPSPGRTDAAEPLADEDDWLAATWAMLDRNDAVSGRSSRVDSAASTHEQTIPSPRGHWILQLRGQGLVGIIGDVRRIAAADAEQLRSDALAVFGAAGLTADYRAP